MFESYKRITNSVVNWISHIRAGNRGFNNLLVSRDVQSNFLESVKYADSKPFVLYSFVEISIRYSQTNIMAVKTNAQLRNIKADDIGVHMLNKALTIKGQLPPKHIDLHKVIYNHSNSRAVFLYHPHYVYVLQHRGMMPDDALLPKAKEILGGYDVVSLDDFPDRI